MWTTVATIDPDRTGGATPPTYPYVTVSSVDLGNQPAGIYRVLYVSGARQGSTQFMEFIIGEPNNGSFGKIFWNGGTNSNYLPGAKRTIYTTVDAMEAASAGTNIEFSHSGGNIYTSHSNGVCGRDSKPRIWVLQRQA